MIIIVEDTSSSVTKVGLGGAKYLIKKMTKDCFKTEAVMQTILHLLCTLKLMEGFAVLYFLFNIKRQGVVSKTTKDQLQVINIYLRLKIYLKTLVRR